MNLPPFTWRHLTLMAFFFLLALWKAAGLLAVFGFVAVAELCLRALDAHQRRAESGPDQEG